MILKEYGNENAVNPPPIGTLKITVANGGSWVHVQLCCCIVACRRDMKALKGMWLYLQFPMRVSQAPLSMSTHATHVHSHTPYISWEQLLLHNLLDEF